MLAVHVPVTAVRLGGSQGISFFLARTASLAIFTALSAPIAFEPGRGELIPVFARQVHDQIPQVPLFAVLGARHQ